MRWNRLRAFALTLLALAAFCVPIQAGNSLPYKGAFDFAVIDVEPTNDPGVVLVTGTLDGNETHLGQFTGEVQYYVDTATGALYGTLYKVAANGDELYETLTGQFIATGAVGDFVMTGGTGRFTHATGGGTYVSTWIVPFSTSYVTFDGTISYSASDRRH